MGLDRSIRLEPFIKIPAQYEEYYKVIKTCGEHENKRGDVFCPLCGDEIKEENVLEKNIMWCEELIGNENLCHYLENETMYLYSNLYDIGIDTDENKYTCIDYNLIQSEIDKFTSMHKEDIKLLESKLNTKVKIEFGFVYEVG